MNSKDSWAKLQKNLGVTFTNSALLAQAFTHRSYLNESKKPLNSNERLEFLGDAILSFLSSRYLYATYPDLPEGMLTNIRSSIVRTDTLASVAKSLQFGNYLFLSRGEEEGGGRTNNSLLADCFEAFLGALYLEHGLDDVEKILQKYLFSKIPAIVETRSYLDYKSQLQEKIQEHRHISPLYRVVRTEGKDHAKTFWIEVVVDNKVLGEGKGKSKQEAEQKAAQSALARSAV